MTFIFWMTNIPHLRILLAPLHNTTHPQRLIWMRLEQEQKISEWEKKNSDSVPFSLHDPHSNIILDASVTSTYADRNWWQKPNGTFRILDQKICRYGILVLSETNIGLLLKINCIDNILKHVFFKRYVEKMKIQVTEWKNI